MDQSTKQRLVGAVVLVVAVLWIVPIFLDGPAEAPDTISETVELPGIEVTPTEQRSIDLDAPLAAPPDDAPPDPVAANTVTPRVDEPAAAPAGAALVPDTESNAPQTPPDEKPRPVAGEKEPETPTAADVAERPPARAPEPPAERDAGVAAEPDAVAADGLWAVQLGSFAARDNASRLAAELREQGMTAFLTELTRDGAVLHRVRVGPVADRAAAEKLASELAAKGHRGRVVPHP